MSNYNIFIDENIDAIFEHIEEIKENITYFDMKGDKAIADKYIGVLEALHQKIGALVLNNRETAEKVQEVLKEEFSTHYYRIEAQVDETNEIIECVCADDVLHPRGSEIKEGQSFTLLEQGNFRDGQFWKNKTSFGRLLKVEKIDKELYETLSNTCESMWPGASGEFEWLEIQREDEVVVVYAVEGTPDTGMRSSGCLYEWKGEGTVKEGDVVYELYECGKAQTVTEVKKMKVSEADELMKIYDKTILQRYGFAPDEEGKPEDDSVLAFDFD